MRGAEQPGWIVRALGLPLGGTAGDQRATLRFLGLLISDRWKLVALLVALSIAAALFEGSTMGILAVALQAVTASIAPRCTCCHIRARCGQSLRLNAIQTAIHTAAPNMRANTIWKVLSSAPSAFTTASMQLSNNTPAAPKASPLASTFMGNGLLP